MVPNTQPGSRQNGETETTLITIAELVAGLRARSQAGMFSGRPPSAHRRLSLELEIADRHLNLYTPIIDCATFFGYPPLLTHILDGQHYGPMLRSPEVAQHRAEWRAFFKSLIECPPEDHAVAERFQTQWHVSHHFIRELVDEDVLLMDINCSIGFLTRPPVLGRLAVAASPTGFDCKCCVSTAMDRRPSFGLLANYRGRR